MSQLAGTGAKKAVETCVSHNTGKLREKGSTLAAAALLGGQIGEEHISHGVLVAVVGGGHDNRSLLVKGDPQMIENFIHLVLGQLTGLLGGLQML